MFKSFFVLLIFKIYIYNNLGKRKNNLYSTLVGVGALQIEMEEGSMDLIFKAG